MTKIYEALENASKERATGEVKVTVSGPAPRAFDEKLLAMYRRFESLGEEGRGTMVEFVDTQPGSDNSVLAWEFARTVASRLKRRVLLVTVGQLRRVPQLAAMPAARGWEEVVLGDRDIGDALYESEVSGLYVSQMTAKDAALAAILASPKLDAALRALRAQFDVVLFDAPAIGASWNAILVASYVDGVVLTVEAHKTRWQVVKDAINQIEAQRGKVLGVILNKQRHYIPRFVYRYFLH
ncbi:MAG TPA: CpsD/CapB family tyrosine-protein kinase [Candidatus Hydrogenedentes bacterium]|nr:CpsD/CapB family tyrosine-protein kinase [Candidatus Hydrogenedentota bacterium]HPG67283.1 CpsD/CapB family tyrosine-protein kinase [Candidatus Hydrogenedentota bacterium]